jgi:tetratricopeptide (TPR) repeat protein
MNKINNKLFYIIVILIIIVLAVFYFTKNNFDIVNNTEQGLFLEVNMSEEARKDFEDRRDKNLSDLELFPGNYTSYLDLGNIERELGNATQAIEYFKQASELIPTNSTPWLNIGNVYYRLAMYDETIASFEVARSLSDTYYLVYFNLAKVYKAQDYNNTQRVMDIFEEGIVKTNNDYQLIYFYSSYLREMANNEKALEYLQLFVEHAPEQEMKDLVNLEIEEVRGLLGQ